MDRCIHTYKYSNAYTYTSLYTYIHITYTYMYMFRLDFTLWLNGNDDACYGGCVAVNEWCLEGSNGKRTDTCEG